MEQARIIRIVVASPSDVMPERNALANVVEKLNQGIARQYGLRLELARWETDSFPGFHIDGPQALIDSVLRIEDCDILIGIFWKRFGSPTKNANSGTEHEIRTAYEAWKRNRRPDIKVYFNKRAYSPSSVEETQQWGQVLEFQRQFPPEGMWWEYNGKAQFEDLVRSHLEQFVFNIDLKPPKPTNQDSGKLGKGSGRLERVLERLERLTTVSPTPDPVANPVGVIARTTNFLRRNLARTIISSVLLLGFSGAAAYQVLNRHCSLTNVDFRDQFSNLNNWAHLPPSWKISNGSLVIENSPHISYVAERCYRNFTMRFQVIPGSDGGAAWALRVVEDHSIFQNGTNYYLFYLSGPTGNYKNAFMTFKVRDGKPTQVLAQNLTFPLLADCTYEVAVEAKGGHFFHKIKLNNAPDHLLSKPEIQMSLGSENNLGDYTDPDDEFPQGSVGFITMQREVFSIRSLIVEPLK